jgi:hypothetical protein
MDTDKNSSLFTFYSSPFSKNSMKFSDTLWLSVAFVLSVLATGLPFWFTPYRDVALPTTLIAPVLLVPAVCAMLLVAYRKAPWLRAVLITAASLPVAVLLRIVVETTMDPTSHNLWPFELIIATMLGLVPAGIGGLAGWVIRRIRVRREAA